MKAFVLYFARMVAQRRWFRLVVAVFVIFYLCLTGLWAFDQWGDNGSSPVGGGSNPNASNPGQSSSPNGDKNGQGKKGEPVDLFSGQFELENTDINIPGRMPLRVKRFYRSGSTYQGMYGHGWNIEYNERIFILATNGNLLLRRNNTARDEFANRGDNTFTPPAGCYDSLSRNSDGSYTLLDKHGTIHSYNSDGCLTQVRDRNGNQLLLTYQPGVNCR